MKTAISLYLRSRNCYQALKEYLDLPHQNTIESYFGTLDTPGSVTDCRNTIPTVFNKLSGKEKYCKVLLDKIHEKPAVRYQGNHIIGSSHDEPTKAARAILPIMIAPMMVAPAFVCRLIPLYSLKRNLILEQTKIVITIIHQNGGCTFALMADSLRADQACLNLYKEIFGGADRYLFL